VRIPWKVIGLAGAAGVAASGAAVVRRRRGQQDYDPDALRSKLRERLAETRPPADPGDGMAGDEPT
jgi:hypothetical protein